MVTVKKLLKYLTCHPLGLQVPDGGEELRGVLVPVVRERVALLRPLVVGKVGLLHHELLDGGVGSGLEKRSLSILLMIL